MTNILKFQTKEQKARAERLSLTFHMQTDILDDGSVWYRIGTQASWDEEIICGDEDPEYLFTEYFKKQLQETIYRRLIEVQASNSQIGYMGNIVCDIINEAWNEITAYWNGRRAFENYGFNRMWATNEYLGTELSKYWEEGYNQAIEEYYENFKEGDEE